MSDQLSHDALAAAIAVLRAGGRTPVADELERSNDGDPKGVPTVMVAGEDKRGKSSLVNALLGAVDLSPVGVEVTTGCPISFAYAEIPTASLLHYGDSEPVALELAEAQRLATVQGNPQNVENVRAVQLGTPSPLLENLMIIDTPGVGGLNSGHAELTLQTLPFADALLFVIEAGAQFRAPELQFLKRASARINTVILALTKTDLHRGWRTILDDNIAVLKEQAPRFTACPVVPVSSALAQRAMRSDDPEDIEALFEESGIPTLRQVLIDQVALRGKVLDESNRLRTSLGPMKVVERAIVEKLKALETGGASQVELEEEQARLVALGEQRAEWPRKLDRECRRLSLERTEECTRGMVEIRRRYDERLKNPSKEDVQTLPGELVADLTALAGHLNELSIERLMALVVSVLDDIDSTTSLRDSIGKLTTDSLEERLGAIGLGTVSLARHEKLSIVSSFSTGRSFGGLLSGSGLGVTATAFVAPPIAIAIGLGVGGLFAYQAFKGRSKQIFSQEFRGWMGEQCQQASVTINTTFSREMLDLQDEIKDLVRDALAERERQIKESLEESKAMLAQAESERQQTQKRLQIRLVACREAKRDVVTALKALGESPDPLKELVS